MVLGLMPGWTGSGLVLTWTAPYLLPVWTAPVLVLDGDGFDAAICDCPGVFVVGGQFRLNTCIHKTQSIGRSLDIAGGGLTLISLWGGGDGRGKQDGLCAESADSLACAFLGSMSAGRRCLL